MGKSSKARENRQERFRQNQRKNSLRALGLAGTVGAGVSIASQAKATPVSSFGDLMESGHDLQPLNNYSNGAFTVNGQTPSVNYYFGFFDNEGHVVGYLDSVSGYPQYLLGAYNGDPAGSGGGALSIGERPYNIVVIGDENHNDSIGEKVGDNFTIDYGDSYWFTENVEINGFLGGISELPAYTGSGSLTLPPVNLVPEPVTSALLGIGLGAVLVGKKINGLIGRLFKR